MATRQIVCTSFNQDKYIFSDLNFYLKYISEILDKKDVKICFIGVANGDNFLDIYFFKFYLKFKFPKWTSTILKKEDLYNNKSELIYTSDIVFIGGGKTTILLETIYDSQFDKKLREAYRRGVIMSGVSAGLLCWFSYCITDSYGDYSVIKGLSFLKESATPHYNVEDRKKYYHENIKNKEIPPGYGIPDGSILHIVNEEIYIIKNNRHLSSYVEY